jgi:hypothetical protein
VWRLLAHPLHVPDPRLHVAVADLLEAGLTNHPVEQIDGVVLHSGAGEGTDQMAADPAGGRPGVGN